MIKLDHVSVKFQEKTILDDLSLELAQQKIAIVGANGSGKSTFLRLLNGLRLPQSGSVTVDGLDTKKHGKDIRKKVGFVFQNPDNQIIMPVVEEDLAFGMKNIGLDRQEMSRRIDAVLERYQLQATRLQPTHLLSGGQKQLLAIAGVVIMEPSTIIFDEPTTQLDLRNKRKITETILALPQNIIVVSHDLDLLGSFDRILVFDQGRIVCDDMPKKAISYYEKLMA